MLAVSYKLVPWDDDSIEIHFLYIEDKIIWKGVQELNVMNKSIPFALNYN